MTDQTSASVFGSDVVIARGFVHMAGAIGEDGNGQLIPGSIADRTKAAFKVIEKRLASVGLELTDIVHITIYLSNYHRDFASFNAAYRDALPKTATPPARICIGVADLYEGTDVELSAIAVTRD
ncbi:uncharacterized protein I303_106365 [Kwoniella dejecticola CBS 10117]|uniref:Uncharacterized protein n=1 Tax=Kwoniella dejecticola CBS 10117 TaxID=1296121 RepID=A0A1A5ZUX4_9TREE|nr:uncharacterized protein I303_08378 [Kwoniella dejecticola CBS 10117]OBR81607.1 hypothetical protein I303_08378 [Kwoniella dejecticola CBS 10117]